MSSKLGSILEERVLDPGTSDSGVIKHGQTLRIIDIEGQQVADFIAWRIDDPSEYQDVVYSNFANGSWKIGSGGVLVSNHMSKFWTITEDDCEEHYMGGGFCSSDLYTYEGNPPHDGCRDRLQKELAKYDLTPLHLREVSCFNIFMHVAYDSDGTWEIRRPISKAGDHIDLRAEMDLHWAVSICDDPWSNGDGPTPMRFEFYDAIH